MSVPQPPRLASVFVAGLLAFLWLFAFVALNGMLLASYLSTGRIGMTWSAVILVGFPGLVCLCAPALMASYVALLDTAAPGTPRGARRAAWAALAVSATGPAEALAIVVLFCGIWKTC